MTYNVFSGTLNPTHFTLSRYSNKIESFGLRKCPYYRYLIEKVTSADVRITNISQSLPHKMAGNS